MGINLRGHTDRSNMPVKDRVSEWRWYAQACTYHTIAYTGTETAVFVHRFCETKATLNDWFQIISSLQKEQMSAQTDLSLRGSSSPPLDGALWLPRVNQNQQKGNEIKCLKASRIEGIMGIITLLMQPHISRHPRIPTWNFCLCFVHIFFVHLTLTLTQLTAVIKHWTK